MALAFGSKTRGRWRGSNWSGRLRRETGREGQRRIESDFATALAEWHDFYAVVAGISATLIGLLFVALGLNPRIMADDGPAGMRLWSALTFHSFLIVLVIALVALIPDNSREAIAITLLIIGVQGVFRVITDLRRSRDDPDPRWTGRSALIRSLSPAIAYAMCWWLAVDLWQGDSDALGWLVVVVVLLLISAAGTCWDPLKAIGEQHKTT
jgi:hypothetical protein